MNRQFLFYRRVNDGYKLIKIKAATYIAALS